MVHIYFKFFIPELEDAVREPRIEEVCTVRSQNYDKLFLLPPIDIRYGKVKGGSGIDDLVQLQLFSVIVRGIADQVNGNNLINGVRVIIQMNLFVSQFLKPLIV
jgi:hypothetical protein